MRLPRSLWLLAMSGRGILFTLITERVDSVEESHPNNRVALFYLVLLLCLKDRRMGAPSNPQFSLI